MEIHLKRLSGCKFEARNAQGNVTFLDGPPDLGGVGEGLRPMEMVLVGLAGCSAMDVIHILKKSRKSLDHLDIQIKGNRADAIPAVFTDIHLHFEASGDFSQDKLEKTVALSVEKYCSVAKMLDQTVTITHSVSKI